MQTKQMLLLLGLCTIGLSCGNSASDEATDSNVSISKRVAAGGEVLEQNLGTDNMFDSSFNMFDSSLTYQIRLADDLHGVSGPVLLSKAGLQSTGHWRVETKEFDKETPLKDIGDSTHWKLELLKNKNHYIRPSSADKHVLFVFNCSNYLQTRTASSGDDVDLATESSLKNQWIIKKVAINKYNICQAYNATCCLSVENSIDNKGYAVHDITVDGKKLHKDWHIEKAGSIINFSDEKKYSIRSSIGTDNYVPGSHAWKIKKDPDRWGNNYSICSDSGKCFVDRLKQLHISDLIRKWNITLLSNGNYYISRDSSYMTYQQTGLISLETYTTDSLDEERDQENQWIIEEYNEDKEQSAVND
ncbi:MAG: hypothetical protein AAF310_03700 [Myxococcota bacterium]